MKKDRTWYDGRQKTIRKHAERLVAQALEGSEAYSDPVERAYLIGATSVPLLAAGFLHVEHEVSGPAATDWLREQLGGLAATIQDLAPAKIRITLSVESAE